MAESHLQSLVIHRCKELGPDKAAEFFAVAPGLVRQWLAGSKTPSLAAVEKVFVAPNQPPTDASWEGREVFIALPFYKTTSPRTLWSILGVWDRAKFRAGTRFDDAFIAHARNQLADDYLKSGCPWCWWIDDDTLFPNGSAAWYNKYAEVSVADSFAGLNTPVQLRSHNKSIVSGVYFGRHARGRACYAEALEHTPAGDIENRKAHAAPFAGLQVTAWAGLGCLMHSRQVLLDIQEKNPHLAPNGPGKPFQFFSNASDAIMRAVPELKEKIDEASFQIRGGSSTGALEILTDVVSQIESAERETRANSQAGQGEDRTFGLRAADAGHPTHIDFSVLCGHLGSKVFNSQNTES